MKCASGISSCLVELGLVVRNHEVHPLITVSLEVAPTIELCTCIVVFCMTADLWMKKIHVIAPSVPPAIVCANTDSTHTSHPVTTYSCALLEGIIPPVIYTVDLAHWLPILLLQQSKDVQTVLAAAINEFFVK